MQTLIVHIATEDVRETPELEPGISDTEVRLQKRRYLPLEVPFEEELPAARQVYQAAKAVHEMRCMIPGSGEPSMLMRSTG